MVKIQVYGERYLLKVLIRANLSTKQVPHTVSAMCYVVEVLSPKCQCQFSSRVHKDGMQNLWILGYAYELCQPSTSLD